MKIDFGFHDGCGLKIVQPRKELDIIRTRLNDFKNFRVMESIGSAVVITFKQGFENDASLLKLLLASDMNVKMLDEYEVEIEKHSILKDKLYSIELDRFLLNYGLLKRIKHYLIVERLGIKHVHGRFFIMKAFYEDLIIIGFADNQERLDFIELNLNRDYPYYEHNGMIRTTGNFSLALLDAIKSVKRFSDIHQSQYKLRTDKNNKYYHIPGIAYWLYYIGMMNGQPYSMFEDIVDKKDDMLGELRFLQNKEWGLESTGFFV